MINRIETKRLLMRKFEQADAPFILELLNEPAFIKHIGDRNVRSLEDAEKYISNGPVASYAKNGFGLCLVILKETSESIGMCGLIKRDALPDVDLGYAFLPKFWSQGYANESTNAMLNYGWNTVNLNRIVAIADPVNAPSKRVLEKLGFVFEKTVQLKAGDLDLNLYAIHNPATIS